MDVDILCAGYIRRVVHNKGINGLRGWNIRTPNHWGRNNTLYKKELSILFAFCCVHKRIIKQTTLVWPTWIDLVEWFTIKAQANNKRNKIFITYFNDSLRKKEASLSILSPFVYLFSCPFIETLSIKYVTWVWRFQIKLCIQATQCCNLANTVSRR